MFDQISLIILQALTIVTVAVIVIGIPLFDILLGKK